MDFFPDDIIFSLKLGLQNSKKIDLLIQKHDFNITKTETIAAA